MTDLHSQLLEHLGYEKNQVEGNNSGNSRNGVYKKLSGIIMANEQ